MRVERKRSNATKKSHCLQHVIQDIDICVKTSFVYIYIHVHTDVHIYDVAVLLIQCVFLVCVLTGKSLIRKPIIRDSPGKNFHTLPLHTIPTCLEEGASPSLNKFTSLGRNHPTPISTGVNILI